jgi:hypothetical protein
VYVRHCKTALRKHVFPKFDRPAPCPIPHPHAISTSKISPLTLTTEKIPPGIIFLEFKKKFKRKEKDSATKSLHKKKEKGMNHAYTDIQEHGSNE